ncbi:ankyrin repeat domain-containing protein [Kineosporia mesophila]|uniref:Ankyrin repeat domain-containing protein n=1 Tax=Kineosporia mesophila TaxID=566012 RepID=A0ABP7AB11_9ACTN|nr:ankyrin repeat domain-containing protein [Kineosporia mesophila]MCD5351392.1 ankyrin repeat domain-containing protein [Kineosporia mesophila]
MTPAAEHGAQTLTPAELEFLQQTFDLAREGETGALGLRIDAGVPVNLTNSSGDTLLILAAYYQHAAAVDLLLARGADTSRINDRGQTALGAAVFRQSEPIVRALLDAGADPGGGTPSAVGIAQFFHLDEMSGLLQSPPTTAG